MAVSVVSTLTFQQYLSVLLFFVVMIAPLRIPICICIFQLRSCLLEYSQSVEKCFTNAALHHAREIVCVRISLLSSYVWVSAYMHYISQCCECHKCSPLSKPMTALNNKHLLFFAICQASATLRTPPRFGMWKDTL